MEQRIIEILTLHFPDLQAIYLFGSRADKTNRPDSDYDIALLLPHNSPSHSKNPAFSSAQAELENELKVPVDLINLRQVSTVFQKEIISFDKRIFCSDLYAADQFEMLTLSLYDKLNEERKEIIDDFIKTGRAY